MPEDKYEYCKRCSHHLTNECKTCKEDDNDKFDELYDADADCKHDIKASLSGGVHCTKCGGWFCF